ncbi:hypothetical protein H6F93_15535 [Leptolyngbya sp. FACHB-671]|nr:hypothetical protein [Leptolyngbya sp. FACHB-671]
MPQSVPNLFDSLVHQIAESLASSDEIERQPVPYPEYENDPVGFALHVLGVPELTQEQIQFFESVRDRTITNVRAGHGIGKCVAKGDKLLLSSGLEVSAESLVDKQFNLLTLVDGKVVPVPAVAGWNLKESIYEVTTETGRRILRNAEHPLYTAIKWSQDDAEEIIDARHWTGIATMQAWLESPPDYQPSKVEGEGWTMAGCKHDVLCAVPQEIPVFGARPMPEPELTLLAYLVGDGGMTRGTPAFEEVRKSISPIGCLALLQKHELMGRGSPEKRIPDCIFELPKDQLATFLSRLFFADGWACVSKDSRDSQGDTLQAEIGFCSVSRELVEQVQRLLLRFGIIANVAPKEKGNAWMLFIHEGEQQLRFTEEIGIYGKEEALKQVVEVAQAKIAQVSEWRKLKAPDGTVWEKVVSIRKLEEPEWTVAIGVPEHETFLTSFFEHNSFGSSVLVIWWVFAVGGYAITTAPSEDQVKNILWREVRQMYDRNKAKLGGYRGMMFARLNEQARAEGITSRDYDTNYFQGKHDEKLLIILDEANGITKEIDDGASFCITGSSNRLLRIGNPTETGTAFYEACAFSSIGISVWSHPNVSWAYERQSDGIHRLKPAIAAQILKPPAERLDDPVKPQDEWPPHLPRDVIKGAVSIAWIERLQVQRGEGTPYWESRVEGRFPEDSCE